jgi:cell division protein FtsI (penicillin-binding protein 3)
MALLPVVKLTDVQLQDASSLRGVGLAQRRSSEEIPALRGAIVDRNGVELAVSVPRTTVALSRRALTGAGITSAADLEEIALDLAEELGLEAQTVVGLVLGADEDDDDVVLGEDVEPDRAAAARRLLADRNLPGVVGIRTRAEREYPAGRSGVPMIGTLGPDGPAEMAGVERVWDEQLSGSSGRRTLERGRDGNTIIGSDRVVEPPRPGVDVQLTLDRTLQYEAERYLLEGADDAGASEGVAIIGHPHTGELLAVAGVERDEDTGEMQLSSRPLAVSNAYQAGSVFKLVTAAAAYEAGVVTATRQFTVPSSMQVDDATFTDAHEHPTEQMDVDRIVAESSNVGTIQMGLFLGKERLYSELQDFGFGRRTGVGHPAESEGQLPDVEGWTRPDLAAASIGTFQSTTPVQLWTAYNVIANGGMYVPPRLVSGTVDADGDTHRVDAEPARRVVSAATAAEVDRALRRVVEQGTAKQWGLPGYPVAAKTGTSRIPSPEKVDPEDDYVWVDGRYHYVTTFAGYLPADRPQVSITVMLYDTAPSLSGSTSAGPVFSDLARMSIRELVIAPTEISPTEGAPTEGDPAVTGGTGTGEPAGSGVSGSAPSGRVRAVPAPAAARGSTRSGSTSTTMAGSSGRTTSAGGTAAGAG